VLVLVVLLFGDVVVGGYVVGDVAAGVGWDAYDSFTTAVGDIVGFGVGVCCCGGGTGVAVGGSIDITQQQH